MIFKKMNFPFYLVFKFFIYFVPFGGKSACSNCIYKIKVSPIP